MKTIRVKKNKVLFQVDCNRIQNVLFNKGLYATLEQCEELWSLYSEFSASGWLPLDGKSDQDIYECVKSNIEEFPEGSVDTRYM
jgi:hypothetical protein